MPEPNVSHPVGMIARNLQAERLRAGISLSELAKHAQISKSTLSQLESGQGNPSVETLWALCRALDITLADLFDATAPQVRLIRAGDGPVVASERANYITTMLSSSPNNARRDVYLISAQPGNVRASEPHNAGVVEHVILGQGRALVGPSDAPVELHPGDYLGYPGDQPHIFQALDADTQAVLISESN